MTNTNTTEWGNIELPGLSDEELFKKKWNLVGSNVSRKGNKTYSKNCSIAQQKYRLDPVKDQKQRESVKVKPDHWYENNRKAMIRNRGTPLSTPLGKFETNTAAGKIYAPIWNISLDEAGKRIRKYCKDINIKDWYYLEKSND